MTDSEPSRVLVVDDSPFMRKAISRILNADPSLTVVGTASDGVECLERLEELEPDVVTLDIVMPRMDGMTALKEIMRDRPVPVVMLSTLAASGAEISIMALEIGAVDIVEKPASLTNMDVFKIGPELVAKVKAAAGIVPQTLKRLGMDYSLPTPGSESSAGLTPGKDYDVDAVIIGSSTGGPAALQRIVSTIASDARTPLAIVQHMPVGFTCALAERLQRMTHVEVKEAQDGDVFDGPRVLVARSGMQMHFERRRAAVIVRLDRTPADTAHVPSIDVSMKSAAEVFGARALGVLLTGMGADGAAGLLEMFKAGAPTIAEAASSAVIYGMPRVAREVGAAAEVLDLSDVCLSVRAATRGPKVQVPG